MKININQNIYSVLNVDRLPKQLEFALLFCQWTRLLQVDSDCIPRVTTQNNKSDPPGPNLFTGFIEDKLEYVAWSMTDVVVVFEITISFLSPHVTLKWRIVPFLLVEVTFSSLNHPG